MEYRIEHDSMGGVGVPADKYWGAQTQRSRQNFAIGAGLETMPGEIIHAFGILKRLRPGPTASCCPSADRRKLQAITRACDEVIAGALNDHFPLVVWQTGSGTQSNMNANEVVAGWGNALAGKKLLHPNDDVNRASPPTTPSPPLCTLPPCLRSRSGSCPPSTRWRPPSGVWRRNTRDHQNRAHPPAGRHPHPPLAGISGLARQPGAGPELLLLAGAPGRSWRWAARRWAPGSTPPRVLPGWLPKVSELTGKRFCTAPNKFHALTSKDELVFAHGALKALAADLMKIANDVRWLASGPRDGLAEITIPENEPGSSIMPGKVNPTQCEAVTMVAVQVMGNDTAGLAASQGNFELNVFMPVLAYNFLQSAWLLAEAMLSFNANCAAGIRARPGKMKQDLACSLMLVTALNPSSGTKTPPASPKRPTPRT